MGHILKIKDVLNSFQESKKNMTCLQEQIGVLCL